MEYRKIKIQLGSTIDEMVELLQEYNKLGEKVCIEFNEKTFYSDTVSLDNAYIEITGMNRSDFIERYGKQVVERKSGIEIK